jgi:hypothetical protein
VASPLTQSALVRKKTTVKKAVKHSESMPEILKKRTLRVSTP